MLTIRLRRVGKRQHATYRFVVMEKRRAPHSRVVEFLGSYDPHTDPTTVKLKRDRAEYWLKQGAQPSETVHNILIDAGLLSGPKVKVGKSKSGKARHPAPAEATAPAVETSKAAEQKVAPAPAEPKKEEAKA